jgi:ribosome-associated protein
MDIRKLQRAIVDGLEDVKAHNIVVFNTEHLTPLFERVIIASGTSNRQTKALASSVRETVKARGLNVLRTEGEANGEWIIVDCGAAVVHLMQPAIRDYYHLEELWGEKSVKMKLDSQAATLVKASTPAAAKAGPLRAVANDAGGKAGAKKAGAKKAVATKGAVKHAASRPVDARGGAQAGVKSVAKRGAKSASETVAKSTNRSARGAAPGTAKAAAPRNPVARKAAAARPSAPRQTPARKTVVRKGVAKKAASRA